MEYLIRFLAGGLVVSALPCWAMFCARKVLLACLAPPHRWRSQRSVLPYGRRAPAMSRLKVVP